MEKSLLPNNKIIMKNVFFLFCLFLSFVGHSQSKQIFESPELKTIIGQQDFGKLRKFLRLYNHASVESTILKTILVNTKAFNNNTDISDIRNSLKDILEKKVGNSLT